MWRRVCLSLIVSLLLGSCDLWSPAKGVAWEFERNGTRLLLIPTVHVGANQPRKLSTSFKEQLLTSSVLLVEVNTLDPSVLQELNGCRNLSALSSNTRISKEAADRMMAIFPDTREEVLKDLPMTSSAVSFIFWRTYSHYKLHEKNGLDLQLIETFKKAGKSVRSLEDICAQMSQIGRATALATNETVLESLTIYSSGDAATWLEQIHDGWRNGSWDLIKCSILELEKKYPHHRPSNAMLIDERNPGLALAISKQAVGDRQITAAVGAKHFVGDRSLPMELLALGFRTKVDAKEWTGPCRRPGK